VASTGIKELLEAGVHWPQTRPLEPQDAPLHHGEREGSLPLDLAQTESGQRAQKFVSYIATPGRNRSVRRTPRAGPRRRQGRGRARLHALRHPPLAGRVLTHYRRSPSASGAATTIERFKIADGELECCQARKHGLPGDLAKLRPNLGGVKGHAERLGRHVRDR